MADQTLNRFLAFGTDAQRTAFTPSVPSPASGPSQAYSWYATDTGIEWAYVNGAWQIQGAFGATISPASLSTSQNNYNPSGLSTAGVIRLTASAPVNITGLTAPTPGNNQTIVLTVLAASSAITLKSLSGSSSAANQFGTAGDIAMAAGNTALLSYDSTSSLWRVVTGAGSGSGTVTSVATDNTYVTGGTISTTGTISATTLTEASVDSAQHTLCGGI